MRDIVAIVQRLASNENGQDLMEYGLLVVLIALVAMVAVGTFGFQLNSVFWQTIANNF